MVLWFKLRCNIALPRQQKLLIIFSIVSKSCHWLLKLANRSLRLPWHSNMLSYILNWNFLICLQWCKSAFHLHLGPCNLRPPYHQPRGDYYSSWDEHWHHYKISEQPSSQWRTKTFHRPCYHEYLFRFSWRSTQQLMRYFSLDHSGERAVPEANIYELREPTVTSADAPSFTLTSLQNPTIQFTMM